MARCDRERINFLDDVVFYPQYRRLTDTVYYCVQQNPPQRKLAGFFFGIRFLCRCRSCSEVNADLVEDGL